MSVHTFGIRHHGPGSARHTLEALQALRPDIVLVEGPPEGEGLLTWVAHPDMHPPVALLAYEPQSPQNAVFYPFVNYSPEWQAIRYALSQHIPVRFIDMPLAHKLAIDQTAQAPETEATQTVQDYPLQHLAKLAGYEDTEAWWDQHIEQPFHTRAVFDTIANAMRALRVAFPDQNLREQRREAFMRRAVRTAQAELFDTIAVVCGAWHVPAFDDLDGTKTADEALLKKLPKVAIETTWIPWTNDRMMFESGYGAGISSPGWYEHNWNHPHDDGTHWLALTAQAFRTAEKDISSAHVIEAVRLANALARLRDLPKAGLYELTEATQTVMCMGDALGLQLIRAQLIVGNRLGQIPSGVLRAPLQQDFEQTLRRLRLKTDVGALPLELDLRKENDLERSRFLHRLRLLGVEWGTLEKAQGKGTFKEQWKLYWRPEMQIALIEKANWGNTVLLAANQYTAHLAAQLTDLSAIVRLLHQSMPAELPQCTAALLHKMDALAADTSDVTALLQAFPPLADLYQYGSVRQTDKNLVSNMLLAVFYRLVAGLPPACNSLDEQQAQAVAEHIKHTHAALRMLDLERLGADWTTVLWHIASAAVAAPFLRGTCCKLLYDARALPPEQLAVQFSQSLSLGNPPTVAVAWMEGFLSGAATVLLLDAQIWQLVHQWMVGLADDTFVQLLPLIRRTFSAYTPAERRKIAEKVKANRVASVSLTAHKGALQTDRAQRVLPVLELLLLPTTPTP